MKLKRSDKMILAALSLLLALSLAMTACGSSMAAYDTAEAMAMTSAAPAARAKGAASSAASYSVQMAPMEAGVAEEEAVADSVAMTETDSDIAAAIPDNRKIVRYNYLVLETKEFDSALEEFARIIGEAGGYIQHQMSYGVPLSEQEERGDYHERSAQIEARIPSERLDEVTASVSGFCNMLSNSTRMEDITDSYFDTEARLNSLTLQEERLLAILEKAEKLEEVITLEQSLSDVRYQIESLTASIRRMDNQVTYSYLSIELQEVIEYQPVTEAPKSFGEELAQAFTRSGRKLSNALENFLFFIIEDAPLMLLELAIFALVVWVIWRLFIRRFVRARRGETPPKKAKKSGEGPAEPPAPPQE